MADRKQPINTICCNHGSDSTRRFSHFKPLSVYARSVFANTSNSFSVSPSSNPDCPSWNLKIEFTNSMASVQRKRSLDDSCFDEVFDTPQKKICLTNGFSPDSHFRQVKLVSLPESSDEALDAIKRVEKTLSDQEAFNGIYWNKNQGNKSFSAFHSSSPLIVQNKGSVNDIAFNYDVDDIMCLSPIDGLEDFSQNYQTNEKQILSKVTFTLGQNRSKADYSFGKESQTESDDGYVTKSFAKGDSKDMSESEMIKSEKLSFLKSCKVTIPNCSNDKTLPESIPVVSTPVYEVMPLLSPNLNLENDSWFSPRLISETVNASSSISLNAHENLNGGKTKVHSTAAKHLPPLSRFVNVRESKEDNIIRGDASKSLMCLNQEQSFLNQLKKDKNHVPLVIQQLAVYNDAEDNFENTLPLQFQEPEVVKTSAHQQPETTAASEGQRNIVELSRPAGLGREREWEKEKVAYVNSVKRHINENGEAGVMTELSHLMDTVANQGRGSDGKTWQHPSDLSRRNYQLRTSSRLLSLDEWQNMNFRSYRRFAKVPQEFKRRPVL